MGRGIPASPHPEVPGIERRALRRLGEEKFAEAALEGTRTDWSLLVEVTLAS
ncbi:hypothetical protein ACFWY6_38075 [Streptomyces sp. NPDC059037]|uniref:hypothetical protein n=1 Tax=Streptomyces sp. NPDC059037 TaxID=3346710 RepID=UPI0036B52ED8